MKILLQNTYEICYYSVEVIVMKRYMMQYLLKWKNSKRRKPLLLTGVRQCGKTYLINQFGEEYFDDVAYLNFEQHPSLASFFNEDLNPKRIISDIENLFLEKPITKNKTLLFLDEIQMAPQVITSLKYFCEDMPNLHVIGAGSLLGVSIREYQSSFPVGKVDLAELQPMNFSEFLWATGKAKVYEHLLSLRVDQEIPNFLFERLKKSLLNYYVIGGMPEVVQCWVDTNDYHLVADLQSKIIEGYSRDFAKYAPIKELPNLLAIWRSIPAQLADDNHKFIFSRAKKSARAKDLEVAMEWLVDAGLIHILKKVENAELPLSIHADHGYYKVYLCDVGLLTKMSGISARVLLNPSADYSTFKGGLTENYVLTELLSQGFSPYYWRSGNTAELDFLIEKNTHIVPIEAKAQINTQAKSYQLFVKRYSPSMGFKLSLKNCAVNHSKATTTYSLPLFLVNRLEDLLTEGEFVGQL